MLEIALITSWAFFWERELQLTEFTAVVMLDETSGSSHTSYVCFYNHGIKGAFYITVPLFKETIHQQNHVKSQFRGNFDLCLI